ncbi:uncharacterized protein LOC125591527 [Brassica napus]|uniref:uncharacterized protein LOC125591527 n=1 Tax=Brassica napus TaxID=3708 RepID=UPI0020795C04|nr:uncharacterized protein LOC125591527 [Brassica napus]
MNCLSLMLNRGAEERKFAYHAKSHSTRLTHLCFADDLLIFTDGTLESVQAVISILDEFALHSGLKISVQKSSFFSSGISQDQVNLISSAMGLSPGVLPVRYLGVPLTTKKLSLYNCGPLIQQIKSRVNSWSSRALSFAGRLLLINTGSHSAKVSWETCTLDKSEGGLGCRDLVNWNTACILKLIWMLFTCSGSIWVARWIKIRVGGGTSVRFWYDNWSPFGKLLDVISPGRTNTMGIPLSATLADIYSDGAWNIRLARSDIQIQVQSFMTTLTLTDTDDSYYWETEGKEWTRYRTGRIYYLLKNHAHTVPWWKLVWNKGGIPKHSFSAWNTMLNRMPTKDRIISWGLQATPACILCTSGFESRDHLYFNCDYSWELWKPLALRCGLTPSRLWTDTISSLLTLSSPAWQRRLILLVWQLVMYSIWQERNSRIHRQIFKPKGTISNSIDRTLRNKIHSSREANPTMASNMIQFWIASSLHSTP